MLPNMSLFLNDLQYNFLFLSIHRLREAVNHGSLRSCFAFIVLVTSGVHKLIPYVGTKLPIREYKPLGYLNCEWMSIDWAWCSKQNYLVLDPFPNLPLFFTPLYISLNSLSCSLSSWFSSSVSLWESIINCMKSNRVCYESRSLSFRYV